MLTSDVENAGTDDTIHYTIIGTEGKTGEHQCDVLFRNDRESGSNESWTIDDNTHIGNYICLQLKNGGTDGWLFDQVIRCILF